MLGSAYRYQYDDSGISSANLIANEAKTVLATDPTVFVLNEGLFYEAGLVIIKGGTPLVKDVDYELVAMDAFYTSETGKGVYAGIKHLTSNMVGDLSITYQCLGGPQGNATILVSQLKEAIDNAIANPSIDFGDIIGVPSTMVPGKHKHYPSDLEDLDLLAQKFDDFVDAIVSVRFYKDSNHSLHNEILRLVSLVGSLRNSINSIAAVSGTVDELNALIDKVDSIYSSSNSNGSINAGNTSEIISQDSSKFNSYEAKVVLLTDDGTSVQDFVILAVNNGTDISYSLSSSMVSGSTIITESDLTFSDAGAMFKVQLTSPEDITYKVKIISMI